jgi:hypothetical protein
MLCCGRWWPEAKVDVSEGPKYWSVGGLLEAGKVRLDALDQADLPEGAAVTVCG